MADLFSLGDARNHPARSGFDLTKRMAFSAKVGEILPVWWSLTFPGDKWSLKHGSFTRTEPVNTQAFTRIREYVDWYYVPLRLISKNLPQALVQTNQAVQASSVNANKQISSDLPFTTFQTINKVFSLMAASAAGVAMHDECDFIQSCTSYKLLDYLGYGSFLTSTTIDELVKAQADGGFFWTTQGNNFPYKLNPAKIKASVNLIPLFVYHKIYNDFIRFLQWEDSSAYTYNVDWYAGGDFFDSLNSNDSQFSAYLGDVNIFSMRYARYNKDIYMGAMPSSQFGDVAVVAASGADVPVVARKSGIPTPVKVGAADSAAGSGNFNIKSAGAVPLFPDAELGVQAAQFSMSIFQIRMAEASQKWKEITQCADQTYRDQIKAHFNVDLSPALSDLSTWVGGSTSNIDFSEVLNTNLIDDNAAYIKGKGLGTGQGYESFDCDDYGVLMCIYHAVPRVDYVRFAPRPQLFYTDAADLPKPEFDSIGMQSLPWDFFSLTLGVADRPASDQFGFVPRFFDLKTDIDEVHGSLVTTQKNWVAPLDWQFMTRFFDRQGYDEINYKFFMVDPRSLDSIFAVAANSQVDTDQLKVVLDLDIHAVRNFDFNGMPY